MAQLVDLNFIYCNNQKWKSDARHTFSQLELCIISIKIQYLSQCIYLFYPVLFLSHFKKKKNYGVLVVKGLCKECKHLFCKFLMHKLQGLPPFPLLMEELLNSVSTQVSTGLLRELPLLKLIVPFCLSVLKPTRVDYALIKLHFTMH